MNIPSRFDQVAALITSIGDQIVAEQHGIAAAEARIAKLYADAASVSDFTAQTMMPVGTPAGRARDLARLSLQAELSAMTRIPERTIQQRISESEVLVRQLPQTLAALTAGSISVGHARVIVDQVADVLPVDRSEFEHRVLPIAKTRTAAQLKQRARILREKLHPATIATRHHTAKQERHVTLVPAADGMSWLSILTTAPIAAAAYGRLAALATGTRRHGDPRTRAQLMTDHAQSLLLFGVTPTTTDATSQNVAPGGDVLPPTLLDQAPNASPAPTPNAAAAPTPEQIIDDIVPTVHVTVPVLSLLGLEDHPGSLEGYGPIDPETAVRLTVNAKSFTRILTHPETGSILSVGRDRYTPPVDLKRTLAIRDTHCRAPGCSRLARGCDLDHTIPWSEGGETSATNLAHLCSKHHHLKHDTNWSLRRGTGDVLHWISPSGREFTTEPDPPDWYPLQPVDND